MNKHSNSAVCSYPVSIIIPVYNAEKHIKRCAISLFEQDFENIEYVFVNDSTPDNSIAVLEEIIEQYPHRKPHIKTINHPENKGSGAARKTGIEQAQGMYTIQVDPDDWCNLDMISCLYQKAVESDADMVICDFFYNYESKESYAKQPISEDKKQNLKNLLSGVIHGAVWNKLVKKSLYTDNQIAPPSEISLLEDKWLNIRLFVFAKKMVYLPKAFLHYWQENTGSLTKSLDGKKLNDLKWYSQTTEAFLKENGLYEENKDYFLMGNLHCVLFFTRDNQYKKNVALVSPKSDKLTYLCRLPFLSFSKKIVYGFSILNMGFVTSFLRNLYLNKS